MTTIDSDSGGRLCVVGRSRHITTTTSPVDVSVCTFGESLVGVLRFDQEGVRTEVVSLSLEKVGREILGTVPVKEGQCSAECRSWDTSLDSERNHVTPAVLSVVDGFIEEIVEQQVLQVRVGTVGRSDVLEED